MRVEENIKSPKASICKKQWMAYIHMFDYDSLSIEIQL